MKKNFIVKILTNGGASTRRYLYRVEIIGGGVLINRHGDPHPTQWGRAFESAPSRRYIIDHMTAARALGYSVRYADCIDLDRLDISKTLDAQTVMTFNPSASIDYWEAGPVIGVDSKEFALWAFLRENRAGILENALPGRCFGIVVEHNGREDVFSCFYTSFNDGSLCVYRSKFFE